MSDVVSQQQQAMMVQLGALLQPVAITAQTIQINGKNFVMVEVERAADKTTFVLEPKDLMARAKELLRAGREALTGLTIVQHRGSGAVDLADLGDEAEPVKSGEGPGGTVSRQDGGPVDAPDVK